MNITRNFITSATRLSRAFSVSATSNATYSCKLLVIGGGTGGCAVAAKFSRRLPRDAVIVLEPNSNHYYQPLWTLVGAGACPLEETIRTERSVLPTNAKWVQDYAEKVNPDSCSVHTRDGHVINYEYLVIATGVENDYEKVQGLAEALTDPNSNVVTIFSPCYASKTFRSLENFKRGHAIFTYPDSFVKCPGAPQKIAYLADSYLRKKGIRSKAKITYNTCLPVIFGVPKYAESLLKVVKKKDINVNYRTTLTAVFPDKREAVFCDKNDNKSVTMQYDFLHAVPPMTTSAFLRDNTQLTGRDGYLTVDKYTLQHTKYDNIYGLGDCTDTPNSKTAAAIAKQVYVLELNLLATMEKDTPKQKYDGYGACPLVTSYNTVIMAEFIYGGEVRETFPWNQAEESKIAFYMKRHLFPFVYWNFMLKGYYHGPEMVRKIVNPFAK